MLNRIFAFPSAQPRRRVSSSTSRIIVVRAPAAYITNLADATCAPGGGPLMTTPSGRRLRGSFTGSPAAECECIRNWIVPLSRSGSPLRHGCGGGTLGVACPPRFPFARRRVGEVNEPTPLSVHSMTGSVRAAGSELESGLHVCVRVPWPPGFV